MTPVKSPARPRRTRPSAPRRQTAARRPVAAAAPHANGRRPSVARRSSASVDHDSVMIGVEEALLRIYLDTGRDEEAAELRAGRR